MLSVTDAETLAWQEQERDNADLERMNREIFTPQARTAIAEMKEEAGAWGLERRHIFLAGIQAQLEIQIMDLEADYLDGMKRGQPYLERRITADLIVNKQKTLERVQGEMKSLIIRLHALQQGKELKQAGLTDAEIKRARQYPIERLVEIGRNGRALCVWHEDHDPSMDCRNNFAYCHACGKHGDTIDLYRQIHCVDFPTAVRALQ